MSPLFLSYNDRIRHHLYPIEDGKSSYYAQIQTYLFWTYTNVYVIDMRERPKNLFKYNLA